MRGFLNVLLTIILIWITPVLIALLILRLSGFNAAFVSQILTDRQVYSEVTTLINSELDQAMKSNEQDNPLPLIAPFIKKELTPTYLQGKVEPLLSSIEVWVKDPSAPPPTLSFQELKDKLLKQNSKLVTELKSFEKEYHKQRPEMERAMKQAAVESGESPPAALPEINVSQFLDSDVSINLAAHLVWLRYLYVATHTGIILIALSLVATLIGIWFVNAPSNRSRRLGFALLIAAVISLIPYSSIYLLSSRVPTIAININLPFFLLPLATTLIHPLLIQYLRIGGILLGTYILAAIVFLLLPRPRK